MKVSIYWALDGSLSIDRYARELAQNFPADVEVAKVSVLRGPGRWGTIRDKYLKYLWVARGRQGDCNLIVCGGYAYLLLALDGNRTLVVCHAVHPLIYRGRGAETMWFWLTDSALYRARPVSNLE